MCALPQFSDVDLLGYGKRIIDLNSEITDRTFDLRVAQQELNCSEISRFLIDQSCPWSCGVNACHRNMDQDRPLPATVLTVWRTAA
jgi:hypothetical protein